jgi:cell division protein FtsA
MSNTTTDTGTIYTSNESKTKFVKKTEQPIIVGLDIGTTKVVVIAGRKNEHGKLEILGHGSADSLGVTHGKVLNIDQCVGCIQTAVANCLKSNSKLEIHEVYVGIAGEHIKSFKSTGSRIRPNVEEEISQFDIDLLIKDQRQTFIPPGDKIIDIIPQDFTVDSTTNIVNPIGMSGVKVGANFHIITGDFLAIKNIIRCVERAKLKVAELVLQPIASAAAVITDEDLEAGVAIVDIGGGTTDMAVFYDNILKHTFVLPYAGVNVTGDIKTGLGVLKSQAEQMKVQFGMALASQAKPNAFITIPGLTGLPAREISQKSLSQIIEARMTEILEKVLHSLQQCGLEQNLYGGIILTGGGAKLTHILHLTEMVTGMNTRIGKPDRHLTGPKSETLGDPMYATCVGLILRGYDEYEKGKKRMNENSERNDPPPPAPEPLPVIQPAPVAVAEPEPEPEPEEPEVEAPAPARTSPKIGRIFDSIQRGLERLFADTDIDKEI